MADRLEFIIGAKDEFSATFGKLMDSFPSMKTLAVGAGAAIAAAGASILAMTKSTAAAQDKVQKLSDQLGVSTVFLSKMETAANFSGVAVTTMEQAVKKLQVGIGQAAVGTGTARTAFEQLGVSLHDANGNLRTAEQMMPVLANALHGVSDASQRAEIAARLFGEEGVRMLQMFTGGAEGLKKMTDEADRFGVTVSAKAGANAAKFNDMLYRMELLFTGLRNALAERIMPVLTGLGERFADFATQHRQEIINFAESFIVSMGALVEKGVWGVALLIDSWRGLQMMWETLKIAFAEFSRLLWEGIDAIVERMGEMMRFMNVRGVFDEWIAGVDEFRGSTGAAIEAMEQMGTSAWDRLNAIVEQGAATEKVEAYAAKIREVLAEINASGSAEAPASEPQGIGIFSTPNIEKTAENIETSIVQQEDGLLRLQEMWNEYMLTENERLDLWYEEQLAKYEGNLQAQVKVWQIYNKRRSTLQKKSDEAEVKTAYDTYGKLEGAAMVFGDKAVRIAKAIALPQAIGNVYTGASNALRDVPFPANLLAAASIIAYGFATLIPPVTGMAFGVAHGGLDYVPREQTYLLDRGERVLSPNQNRDLTAFMAGGSGGGMTIGSMSIDILKNATNADALLNMSRDNWEDLVEFGIIPALRRLAKKGIKP